MPKQLRWQADCLMHLLNSSIRPNDSFLHDVLSDLRKAADIVESLRQQLRAVLGDATNNINAATDEIESLRQRIAELEQRETHSDGSIRRQLVAREADSVMAARAYAQAIADRDTENTALRAQLAEAQSQISAWTDAPNDEELRAENAALRAELTTLKEKYEWAMERL
jgi:chromosome segregation ATPase